MPPHYKSSTNILLFLILVNRFGIALPCAIPNPSFSPKNSHTYNLSAVRGGYMRQHLPCAILTPSFSSKNSYTYGFSGVLAGTKLPPHEKGGAQAIVARLRLASEFAVQTRDKKHRHYFRSCFLSFRFFHAFLISVFSFRLFSRCQNTARLF